MIVTFNGNGVDIEFGVPVGTVTAVTVDDVAHAYTEPTPGTVALTMDVDEDPPLAAAVIAITLTPASTAPVVSGARDMPEEALKNLLAALAARGLITDTTTTS